MRVSFGSPFYSCPKISGRNCEDFQRKKVLLVALCLDALEMFCRVGEGKEIHQSENEYGSEASGDNQYAKPVVG